MQGFGETEEAIRRNNIRRNFPESPGKNPTNQFSLALMIRWNKLERLSLAKHIMWKSQSLPLWSQFWL
jgi:hypothetical protein